MAKTTTPASGATSAPGNGRRRSTAGDGQRDDRARDRSYDAIVIGAGHNGLVNGAYLARAGLRTLIARDGAQQQV